MPKERLIYFGDTAHLPYGDKSVAAIQAYAIKIADLLRSKGCKVIVIACNSASSAAYELLTEYLRKIKIINVIDPMVSMLVHNFSHKKVGLIGTKRTVESNVYKIKTDACQQGIALHSLATPLLVPMIEEGFFNNNISHEIIAQYLADEQLANIDALVLGCTHYPLIKSEIEDYYQQNNQSAPAVLDSSEVVAQALYDYLDQQNLLATQVSGDDEFLVSDYTHSFEKSTERFFNKKVPLQKHPLWE